jgi:hypothetical protein
MSYIKWGIENWAAISGVAAAVYTCIQEVRRIIEKGTLKPQKPQG